MKRSLLVEADGGPLSVVAGANVRDDKLLGATLDAVVRERPETTEEAPQHLCLDKGYDNRWLFLIGFWSATTSSILGGWNAAAYLFADYVRTARRVPEEAAEQVLSERSLYFRGFLAYCAFPPMVLFVFGEPVLMVIIYAALGALLLPFMAITLLWLLNRRVARDYRNRILSNALMVAAVLLFGVLAVQEIIGLLQG